MKSCWLTGFFAFAYAYAKGYEGGNGVLEGVRFGVVAALIVIGFAGIWHYVFFPITANHPFRLRVRKSQP